METLKPREWLAAEFAEKRSANPRYSLRLFASRLGFTPGRLSEYLSGKREITLKQAEKIADRLSYSPSKREDFFASFASRIDQSAASSKKSDAAYRQLSADAFSVVADWQHFAILSLMDLREFRSDEAWIARRLGLSAKEVRLAMIRLERLKLIEKSGNRWKKLESSHTTTHDVPSAALKISHRQTLLQAMNALDEIPVELRDITSITMAIDLKKIPEAKKVIKAFRRKLSSLLEDGNQTEIFNLNIQLVPVTKLNPKSATHDN